VFLGSILNMEWNPQSALNDFRAVAALAGIRLTEEDITIEQLPAPHVAPARLPAGMMAVYVFSLGDEVLKVGKVGPNSHARYVYQHYNAGSAMSTLAGSLLADKTQPQVVDLDPADVSEWIKRNIDRVNFVVSASLGVHALSLLEIFIQCRLKPRYEGFRSQRI
jgi:hypothetical protein